MVYPLTYGLILKWLVSDLVSLVIYGAIVAAIYKPLAAEK
jgi:hypothetical protein